MDRLPRLGKRELICLLLFTCNYVVSVWRGFLFLWVLGMGYVILLWHSLSLPYNYFEHMVHRIYPAEFQLNKANASDTEAAFLDLNLSVHNDIVSTKIYDKQDDFNFDFVNFPFLDGDVPRRPYYGVYIFQLIRFARASTHVTDFNNRNKFLTEKGYRYHKLRKAFSKFYRRHFELIEKYHVNLKKLMQQGICNSEFYGDLVYRFKKIIGNQNFSNLFKRIVNRFKRAGYT